MEKNKILIGLFFTFLYLVLQLFLMKDYGISWDFHYHLYGGLHQLGIAVPSIDKPPPVPFTPPDPRLTIDDPFGPIMGIIPALSYQILFETLHLLPFDMAYNLPSVLYGSIGVGILYFFLYQALGVRGGLIGALILGFLPNYFGYLHVNMKDIPVAVVFCLSIYFFWRLSRNKKFIDLFLASLFFGIAFSIKVNAIYIPIICALWLLISMRKKLLDKSMRIVLVYFISAPLAALFIWWPFWTDPVAKLIELRDTFSHNTFNMPVLLSGETYRSGINIPFYYPYLYLAITTPLSILLFFVVGLFISLKRGSFYLLLILWFFVPLLRFFLPNVSVIDGVRHFLEVLFPLAAIAAVGFMVVYSYLRKSKIFLLFIFGSLVYNIVFYHPYQTSFYNLLVGGIRGANGKYDIDFWGTPQKEAVGWLNENAEKGSAINIFMAQSSASMYLRHDLLERVNTKNLWESDYVVILNRPSFWNEEVKKFMTEKIGRGKIAYSRTIDTVPLVWVLAK